MNPRDRAIFLELAGLVLNVLAALLDIVNIYANGAYHFLNFSGLLGIYLGPLGAIAAVGAWWFLARAAAESPAQGTLLEKAMYWFAAEVLVGVVESVNVGLHQSITTGSGSVVWIMGIGGAIEAIGLVMLARVYAESAYLDRGNHEPSTEADDRAL
jgi:hypothetical protein